MAEWPPAVHRPRLDAIRKSRAWYAGERLREDSGSSFWCKRVVTKDEWWGTTSIADDEKVHVPAAADLALTASDFLFGGGVEFLSPEQELVNAAEQTAQFLALLPLGAEKGSGLGETYIRLGWDDELGIELAELIEPDTVLPTFRWGRLASAIVWEDLDVYEGKRWRHLEHHERGVIRHELWLCGPAVAGSSREAAPLDEMVTTRPLTDHPATRDLDPYIDLPPGMADRLALHYVANADSKTKRAGGRSDTEGSEGLMAGLDLTVSGMLRDVDLGKGRVLVDESVLTRTGVLGSVFFDKDARYLSPVGSSGMSEKQLQIVQFAIRADDHLAIARDLIQRIVSAGGYSPESLSVVQGSLPEAASARRARERASLRTSERKAGRWRPVIAEALSSLAVIRAYLNDDDIDPPEVTVTIRNSMAPDTHEVATMVAAAYAAGVMSPQTAVRELHPTWKEERVLEEVAALATNSTDELARRIQQIYLGVGTVITADEAREILNRGGANLSGSLPAPPNDTERV